MKWYTMYTKFLNLFHKDAYILQLYVENPYSKDQMIFWIVIQPGNINLTIENVETEYRLHIKLFLYHFISTVRNKQHGEVLVATSKLLTYPQSNKNKIQIQNSI
jgi:hypothetical protein